jgi:lysozyme family protein
MPSPRFDVSLPFILRWEGGFIDHPADPGGATNKGVTQKVYDAWRARQGQPPRSVRLIENAEMQAIYESNYWVPPRCDLLSGPLDLVQFDTAVNMGPGRAVRFLQSAVNCPVDGDFGPGTEVALASCDAGETVLAYCDAREAFYRAIVARKPNQAVFLRGWLNRLRALRAEAGLPGHEGLIPRGPDPGEHIARIPDIGEDPSFDLDQH